MSIQDIKTYREELVREITTIVDNHMKHIRKILRDHEYNVEYYTTVDFNNNEIVLKVRIFADFTEIGYYCDERVYRTLRTLGYTDNDIANMPEGEYIDLYNTCIDETIEYVNTEYTLHHEITWITDKYNINVKPMYCDNDDCLAGTEIVVKVKNISLSDLEHLLLHFPRIVELLLKL